jgi:selenoprotein W-related protein
LTAKILDTFKQQIADVKLIPSRGGCFELNVDGKLVWSKLKTGQFPDEQKMLNEIESRLHPATR